MVQLKSSLTQVTDWCQHGTIVSYDDETAWIAMLYNMRDYLPYQPGKFS